MKDAIIGLSLDRSGSMVTMWDEALAGFNTFKNDQAAQDGHAWIILNYFDQSHGQKYFAWDAKHIPDLEVDDQEIYPRGMTALLQSVVLTITDVDKWLEENPDFDGVPIVVVITDGMENASGREAQEAAKRLIAEREKAGWVFIYLAANVDVAATAANYGFAQGSSLGYTGQTVNATYAVTSNAITRSRSGGSADFTDDERAQSEQDA